MANVDALELVSQEEGLIKSTPVEETLVRLKGIRVESMQAENGKVRIRTLDALQYIVQYLRRNLGFSVQQVRDLSSEDLNRLPEIIFAAREKKVLLLGWLPLFGWCFMGSYFLFKSRVKFLRSLDRNVFYQKDIEKILQPNRINPSYW